MTMRTTGQARRSMRRRAPGRRRLGASGRRRAPRRREGGDRRLWSQTSRLRPPVRVPDRPGPPPAGPPGSPGVGRYPGQASVSLFQDSCSVSGITRVSATEVMKLVSPDQRGSTCRCTCDRQPGPGRPAQVGAHVQPVGLVGPLDRRHRLSRRRPQLGGLRIGQLGQRPDVAQRQHQDVPAGVGVGVHDDEGQRHPARPPGCPPTAARSRPGGRRRSRPRRATIPPARSRSVASTMYSRRHPAQRCSRLTPPSGDHADAAPPRRDRRPALGQPLARDLVDDLGHEGLPAARPARACVPTPPVHPDRSRPRRRRSPTTST